MKKLMLVAFLSVAILSVNAQTRTEVKVADLNKAITENVAKDHAGFTIKDAYKCENSGVVTFEVKVVKGNDVETLVYDNDGKFVKKVAHKAGIATKKEVKKQEPKKK